MRYDLSMFMLLFVSSCPYFSQCEDPHSQKTNSSLTDGAVNRHNASQALNVSSTAKSQILAVSNDTASAKAALDKAAVHKAADKAVSADAAHADKNAQQPVDFRHWMEGGPVSKSEESPHESPERHKTSARKGAPTEKPEPPGSVNHEGALPVKPVVEVPEEGKPEVGKAGSIAKPGKAAKPESGAVPEKAVKPESGVMPKKAVKPESGVIPGKSIKPESGDMPGKAVDPGTNMHPETGVKPGAIVHPDTVHSGTGGKPDAGAHSETSNKHETDVHPESNIKPGNSSLSDKIVKPQINAMSGTGNHPETGTKAETGIKPGTSAKPEHANHSSPLAISAATPGTTTRRPMKPSFTMVKGDKYTKTSESFIESSTTGKDYVLPIVLSIFAVPAFVFLVKFLYRRGTEFTERQQYHRMYLIDVDPA